MPNQNDIAIALVNQLKGLDPSVSAEIGTPERKIIDAVAAGLADAQIGLNNLSGALDINAKVGDNLDRFLTLFGFARQQPTRAVGYVTFTRNSPATQNIIIPANTQVFASIPDVSGGTNNSTTFFVTQFQATIPAGSAPTPSVTVPIQAVVAGATGNLAANTITSFAGTPVFGITSVTNQAATTGGLDAETDNEFKVRFQNSAFRNLAGTNDQYLGLVAANKNVTKPMLVAPISRYG
ncbi:MAG: hypothetical protein NVSMB70_20360 [Chamaesiphon sp.]